MIHSDEIRLQRRIRELEDEQRTFKEAHARSLAVNQPRFTPVRLLRVTEELNRLRRELRQLQDARGQELEDSRPYPGTYMF